MAERSEVSVVVGIDFGTAFSGFAFAHKDEPDKIYTYYEWPGRDGRPYCKTETGLFYVNKKAASGCQAEYELTHWGWLAQAQQRRGGPGAEAGLHLTNFKLRLAAQEHQDAALCEKMSGLELVWKTEGKHPSFALPEGLSVVRATADFLREISTFALKHVQETWGSHITARNVQWCLTVPAIWDDSAKQMMRKCAEMAGLVTGPSCPRELANTASPHPVRIVLESEAASAYCAKTRSKQLKLKRGDEFMVADIGGGTTDIVVHTMANDGETELKLKEAVQSSGDLCGGTHVDANFFHFLRARIGCFDEVVSQNPALMTALQRRWSDMKTFFDGEENWGPPSLDVSDMKKIFDPVVDGVIQLIREAMTPRLILLLLVGGFSASPYLRARVKAAFAGRLGDNIVMPPDPGSAVCQGAVLFGFSPNLITSRVARKTYVLEEMCAFDSERDPLSYQTWNHDGLRCRNRLSVLVRKGQHVGVDECFSVTGGPVSPDQTTIRFRIFSTNAAEVRYTTEPGVALEGDFTMDISDDPDKLGVKRSWKTSFFFGTPCIRVQSQRQNFGNTNETIELASSLRGSPLWKHLDDSQRDSPTGPDVWISNIDPRIGHSGRHVKTTITPVRNTLVQMETEEETLWKAIPPTNINRQNQKAATDELRRMMTRLGCKKKDKASVLRHTVARYRELEGHNERLKKEVQESYEIIKRKDEEIEMLRRDKGENEGIEDHCDEPNLDTNHVGCNPDQHESMQDDNGSEVRPDIIGEGFYNDLDDGFDGKRVLCLVHKHTPIGETHFSFYHTEGMALLLGVGLANARVVVQDNPRAVEVYEEDDETWRARWTKRNMYSFTPIIFELLEMCPLGQDVNYYLANSDAEQLHIGVVNSSTNMEVMEMRSDMAYLEIGGEVTCPLLALTKLLEGLMGHMQDKMEPSSVEVHASPDGSARKESAGTSKLTSYGDGGQTSNTSTNSGNDSKTLPIEEISMSSLQDQGNVEGPCISSRAMAENNTKKFEVRVILNYKFELNEVSGSGAMQLIDLESIPIADPVGQLKKCYMKCIMNIIFWQEVEKRIDAKFHVTYQLGGVKGVQDEYDELDFFGWYHDNMQIQFECENDSQCHLVDQDVYSDMEGCEGKLLSSTNTSQQASRGKNYTMNGNIGFRQMGQVGANLGGTRQTTKIEGQEQGVETSNPVQYLKGTGITINSIDTRNTLRYQAYMAQRIPKDLMWTSEGWNRARRIGVMNSRKLEVGGQWLVFNDTVEFYTLHIERYLYRHIRTRTETKESKGSWIPFKSKPSSVIYDYSLKRLQSQPIQNSHCTMKLQTMQSGGWYYWRKAQSQIFWIRQNCRDDPDQ